MTAADPKLSEASYSDLLSEKSRRDSEYNQRHLTAQRIARERWELGHDTADAAKLGLTLERYREIQEVALGTRYEWEETWT